MRILGIVAEYNPFHNGHLHQLRRAKETVNPDYTIAVMSGNFVQRGEPALFDKYTRTKMALAGGLDAIFELPTMYALSSGDEFAAAAVLTLSKLSITHLSFGVECDNFQDLMDIAKFTLDETDDFKTKLKNELKDGNSYPKAYATCIQQFMGKVVDEALLSTPNNILAIGYLKAIYRYKLDIIPVPVKRTQAQYHDTTIDGDICSATAIRNHIFEGQPTLYTQIKQAIPKTTYDLLPLTDNNIHGMFWSDFYSDLQYYTQTKSSKHFTKIYDISPELANRISKLDISVTSAKDFIPSLKTKQYTNTRIMRVTLHMLLDMLQSDFLELKSKDYILYVRLLGFRKDATALIKHLREQCDIPFIQKTSDEKEKLSTPLALSLFSTDILASNLYRTHWYQKYHEKLLSDYQQNAVILE